MKAEKKFDVEDHGGVSHTAWRKELRLIFDPGSHADPAQFQPPAELKLRMWERN
jgi:hypothetical protein